MNYRLFYSLFGLGSVVSALLIPAASWAMVPIQCYAIADDSDGDGYARSGAAKVEVQVDKDKKLNCPAGYVKAAGDCDDANRLVHPNREEVPANGVNDNCRDGVDEPEPIYSANGNGNSNTGFKVTVVVNDVQTLAALKGKKLFASLGVAPLSRSKAGMAWGSILAVNGLSSNTVVMTANGLPETTPYQAQIQFYRAGSAAGTFDKLGPVSAKYYTTTDGEKEKSEVRTRILLKGFKEYDDSRRGRVGYLGSVAEDGTRYGANPDELWCSEFYSWVTKDFLKGMSTNDSVSKMADYFRGYSAYYGNGELAEKGRRGDYLALDTDDDGKKNHSGMFLAYEAASDGNFVWTIEGNVGNRVAVSRRKFDAGFVGLGHIEYSMMK